MREAPDPANSQGQEEDDSSVTWTSWMNTCSPVQRTLLTACIVETYKETRVRPLARMTMNPTLKFIAPFSMSVSLGTYIGKIVGSLRKGSTVS